MEMYDDIVINRKVKHLREQIEEHKKTLLELVEKWYHLRYVVQPKIEFEYEKIFGDLEEELEEKATLCSRMERKIELIFVKINRGMRIDKKTYDFIDKTVESTNTVRNNSNQFSPTSKNNFVPNSGNFDTSQNLNTELNKMYRALVKQLHPDVSGETEFFKKFWVPIQDAYKEKNYSKIRVFYKILNSFNFEMNPEEDVISKLEEELKELKLIIGIERRVLERMLLQEPFVYEKNLKNPVWIQEHRKKLKEKILYLEKQIDFN